MEVPQIISQLMKHFPESRGIIIMILNILHMNRQLNIKCLAQCHLTSKHQGLNNQCFRDFGLQIPILLHVSVRILPSFFLLRIYLEHNDLSEATAVRQSVLSPQACRGQESRAPSPFKKENLQMWTLPCLEPLSKRLPCPD